MLSTTGPLSVYPSICGSVYGPQLPFAALVVQMDDAGADDDDAGADDDDAGADDDDAGADDDDAGADDDDAGADDDDAGADDDDAGADDDDAGADDDDPGVSGVGLGVEVTTLRHPAASTTASASTAIFRAVMSAQATGDWARSRAY